MLISLDQSKSINSPALIRNNNIEKEIQAYAESINIKNVIKAVIEIRDSVGNVYSSKHNSNFWAFFTCQSVEELVVLK